jgi:cbb3-type cytochrome oxidase subunit 1
VTWFVRAFVKSSIVWLLTGVVFGLAMAMYPPWVVHRAMHAHMMLLGFVTMFLCGVAYHVVPRFTGRQLRSPWAAGVHWWFANAGLAVMIVGFWLRDTGSAVGTPMLATGGVLSSVGLTIFAWLVWTTITEPKVKAPPVRAPERKLAVLGD